MRDEPWFSNEQLATILKALPDPAFILTRSGRYAAIFGGSDSRYYHDGSVLIGKLISDVLSDEKTAWFMQEIGKALESRNLHVVEYGLSGQDVRGLPPGGPSSVIWFEGRVQALEFQVQGEDAVLWVASNITVRNDYEVRLRIQSETDPLTGLFNRRKLMEALSDQYEMFTRYGTSMSLLIFDIDDFKRVNDEYGHLNGDHAIQVAAEVCRNEFRSTDIPARFGGDEFVILMPHTDLVQAVPIAGRLRLRIEEALRQTGVLGEGTTISGGLSQLMPMDVSSNEALKRADDALYQAKRAGRNCIISQ